MTASRYPENVNQLARAYYMAGNPPKRWAEVDDYVKNILRGRMAQALRLMKNQQFEVQVFYVNKLGWVKVA